MNPIKNVVTKRAVYLLIFSTYCWNSAHFANRKYRFKLWVLG